MARGIRHCGCDLCVKFETYTSGRDTFPHAARTPPSEAIDDPTHDGTEVSEAPTDHEPRLLSTHFRRSAITPTIELLSPRLIRIVQRLFNHDTVAFFKDFSPPPPTDTSAAPEPVAPMSRPFAHILLGTWLHGRPESDSYRLLVDVYRVLLIDHPDESRAIALAEPATGDPWLTGYVRFMALFNNKREMLPTWFGQDKVFHCVLSALGHGWSSLMRPIDLAEVNRHYDDPTMLRQMRAFGHQAMAYGFEMGWGPTDLYTAVLPMCERSLMTERAKVSLRQAGLQDVRL